MRVDKFLQISRLVKRRTTANTLCHRGNILVNNYPVKAGKALKVGDHITIVENRLPPDDVVSLTYEVLEIPSGNVSRSRASTLYRRVE